jgi:Domain of unknown function (DUF4124)
MKRSIWFLLLLSVSAAVLAQTYKWLDEKGRTHYGEKPPQGVRAQEVDTQSYGVETGDVKECHTIICQGKKLEEEKRKKAEQDAARKSEEPKVAEPVASVRGLNFKTFIQIKLGMSEGEVLVRAGKPDQEVTEGSETRAIASKASSTKIDPKTKRVVKNTDVVKNVKNEIIKTYYYLPTVSDPYTSIITFRGGRVANIERVKKF